MAIPGWYPDHDLSILSWDGLKHTVVTVERVVGKVRFDFNKLNVGDVMVVRNNYKGSIFVRFGAWLSGKSAIVDHVIIVHHRDAAGTLWGIQGRPGGVGWIQLNSYIGDRYANANVDQPKSAEQRAKIAKLSEGMLQTPYDWEGIVLDGMTVIGAQWLWQLHEWKEELVPAHVVCSSFADYIYEIVGLPNPGGNRRTRGTSPADWDDFIVYKEWI